MAVVESRDIFGRVSCAQGISEFWKEKSMQENRIDAFERKLYAGLVLSIVATGIMSFSGVCVETAMNVTFPTLMREFGVNTQLFSGSPRHICWCLPPLSPYRVS